MAAFLQTIVTHFIALMVGAAAGWWAKGKYGASAETEAENLAKKL